MIIVWGDLPNMAKASFMLLSHLLNHTKLLWVLLNYRDIENLLMDIDCNYSNPYKNILILLK